MQGCHSTSRPCSRLFNTHDAECQQAARSSGIRGSQQCNGSVLHSLPMPAGCVLHHCESKSLMYMHRANLASKAGTGRSMACITRPQCLHFQMR